MADDNAASPDRNRSAADRPEAALARDLVRTEYRLRNGRRGAGRDGADTPGAWSRLAERLRRLVDRLSGRYRAGTGGPDAGAAGSWQPVPAQTTAPAPTRGDGPSPEGAGASAHPDLVRLERRIGRLPTLRHEAFEDAVLHLLRTEDRFRKAYERSPESMPTVARYAANAHMREALRESAAGADPREPASTRGGPSRTSSVASAKGTTDSAAQTEASAATRTAAEALDAARDRIMAADARQFAALRARWERTAGREGPDTAPGRGRSGFEGPRQDGMADGQAFRAAQRAQWDRLGFGATALSASGEDLTGEGFRAAAEARREQRSNGPSAVPRSTDAFDGQAFLAAERAAQGAAEGAAQGTGPGPDLAGPPADAGRSAPPPPLLSSEGHTAVRSSLDTLRPFLTSTAPGTPDTPTRAHRPAPVHSPTTPTTPQKRGRT
ncbi:hypothetical protein [Streptomyces sp. SID5643]|uniref:hypothetical protein n=1 Tax=Streptomyces sp. SID5643 TaxID=2690307 RepID=UPI001367D8C4|nr:hypothetical protein [Streptomyces sp. SID5643]MZF88496.1 hypothetical protein [Streptomyces sp. SID5643]